MKRSILLTLATILVLFSGCSNTTNRVQSKLIYDKDFTLETIPELKAFATIDSVGLEWSIAKDSRTQGINIYRGTPMQGKQRFTLIGTANRYATHYVDNSVKPNRTYLYTLTTFHRGKESQNGAIAEATTSGSIEGISYLNVYAVTDTVVKLLWKPHNDNSINGYKIERSTNGGVWKRVASLKGRLSPEYIDTQVSRGNRYEYRVIAKSYRGTLSAPSNVAMISL
jgi:fibronectin type 3 domain-containing protein